MKTAHSDNRPQMCPTATPLYAMLVKNFFYMRKKYPDEWPLSELPKCPCPFCRPTLTPSFHLRTYKNAQGYTVSQTVASALLPDVPFAGVALDDGAVSTTWCLRYHLEEDGDFHRFKKYMKAPGYVLETIHYVN